MTTTFHAGYARTFTPPHRCSPRPTDLSLVQNTTQQPSVMQNDPVRAERANVFDVGVVQKVMPGLELGVDAYYKQAKNLIDDGHFGAAYVLTAFNYEKGENVGVELSAKYTDGGFQAYGNLAWARQIATNPISNQFLFDNATPLDSTRRPDRIPVPADPLCLYRPRPVVDRLGRRLLSVLRAGRHRRHGRHDFVLG